MTKVNLRLFLLASAAAMAAAASAQTHSTAAHHTATTMHPPAVSACVTLPTLSPKIPALPTGSGCAKSMVTISEKIDLSPLVGPTIRDSFGTLSTAFTLAYVDKVVGTGPVAQSHMWYTVEYTGYLPDGTKFDSSLDHGDKKTLSFPYGAHRVILGWDLGFEGMRLGGERRLFVPFQMGYGDRGRPPVIPPKSELIFDMKLVSQSPTDPDAPPAPPTPPAQPSAPGSPAPDSPASPGASPGNAPSVNPVPGSQPATPPSAAPLPASKPAPSTPQG